ncbi:LytTR family DNA-binding domain-containing protein [Gramella sp. AN32]|uniref:LytR/AlgR family response regulator transcription factor n=1 Tax=Christiangramia antarctica TaxID=2058158 RepID=A0ABW5X847_9FLAO|nr:LytTR family DNA-binding domain-containing protein [Gramella sp. AN32]MCM4156573.1 DNA-binding response regulator [Gramella sp. AN32]
MRVIIIEDEKPAARRLQRMLDRRGRDVKILLHSVEESISWLKSNPAPDLIFLDIQLSDGISFEIFEHVQVDSAIIFTTAYDEYALKAFKLNSIDYLLKPIDEEELNAAITKFEHRRTSSEEIDLGKLRSLIKLSSSPVYKNRFTTQVGQHLKFIESSCICCFYSENKGTYIRTNEGKNLPLDISLENLEPDLDPKKFYRINRKTIINLAYVLDIISFTNSRLEIKLRNFDDFQLIVSREKVKDFKEWLANG